MRAAFPEALNDRVLLADGAMGTQLVEAGLSVGQSGAAWNLSQPAAVAKIHASYVTAGSDLLITNTFQASPAALARHNLADKTYDINLRAARIARDCIGNSGYVLGDVGPFGGFLEPLGNTTRKELDEGFTLQIAGLLDGGVDAIIIETMTALEEIETAVVAARRCRSNVSLIASVTFDRLADGAFRTMTGTTVEDALRFMSDLGVDVVGCNCGTGLHIKDYVRLVSEYRGLTDRPIMVQPNAGQPRLERGHIIYEETPESMAAEVTALIGAGASVVGGCCGTTPEHIKLFRARLETAAASTS